MDNRILRGRTAHLVMIGIMSFSLVLSGCDSGSATTGSTNGTSLPNGPAANVARNYSTDALVFAGGGTWSSEVSSIESILTSNGASYQEVSSAQLDAMAAPDLAKFGLMIFPGGAGGTEAASVSATTHANLRQAVQQEGVSYLGFCAGSFVAVAPAPVAGGDVSYGFGVVNGPELGYYQLENQGTDIAMTLESFPDGSSEDILWYGGPVTPNVSGGVLAKYPTGDPAISQMWSGNGFVVLSGVHPTATQAMLSSVGMTSTDGIHTDLAWKLMNAALHQQPLPAF